MSRDSVKTRGKKEGLLKTLDLLFVPTSLIREALEETRGFPGRYRLRAVIDTLPLEVARIFAYSTLYLVYDAVRSYP